MSSRRKFIRRSILSSFAVAVTGLKSCIGANSANTEETTKKISVKSVPVVISTWNNQKANEKAWSIIEKGGRAIDAVEEGVNLVEADPDDQSVGYGGRPDRDGNVTLDACIMDESGNAGSVCFLQKIKHPVSVARKVMEDTPHVILAGAGALKFALSVGFKEEDLLTPRSRKEWEEWKMKSDYKPLINIENHDTIGMLALDQAGNISGACTTSGLGYKMQGRVGDSPIIGAGLYIDNEIGGATATGMGEAVLKSVGSFLVVELMRQGKTPNDACKEAVMRIIRKQEYKDLQVGYLAINKAGETGSFSIHPGFVYAVNKQTKTQIEDASSYL